eukprot:tig00020515_g9770.t1
MVFGFLGGSSRSDRDRSRSQNGGPSSMPAHETTDEALARAVQEEEDAALAAKLTHNTFPSQGLMSSPLGAGPFGFGPGFMGSPARAPQPPPQQQPYGPPYGQPASPFMQQRAPPLQQQPQISRAPSIDISPEELAAQRRIEEEIRRRNIDANLEAAYEVSPESFVKLNMLYIDVRVNGTPVKAFVDTGAQTSVMSLPCAQRCGLARLIDNRFQGVARGVGMARIIGKVHLSDLKFGETILPASFTILEDPSIDLLFGLDLLMKFRMTIDLERMELRMGRERVRFLHESELPLSARLEDGDLQHAPSSSLYPAATASSPAAFGGYQMQPPAPPLAPSGAFSPQRARS